MSMYVCYDEDRGVFVVHVAQIGFKPTTANARIYNNRTYK